jgi:hypothetical protein
MKLGITRGTSSAGRRRARVLSRGGRAVVRASRPGGFRGLVRRRAPKRSGSTICERSAGCAAAESARRSRGAATARRWRLRDVEAALEALYAAVKAVTDLLVDLQGARVHARLGPGRTTADGPRGGSGARQRHRAGVAVFRSSGCSRVMPLRFLANGWVGGSTSSPRSTSITGAQWIGAAGAVIHLVFGDGGVRGDDRDRFRYRACPVVLRALHVRR